MGDVGTGLYVSEDVVPVYRNMLRLATVITPNQFELESVCSPFPTSSLSIFDSNAVSYHLLEHENRLLSDITVNSLPSLHSSLHHLHTAYGLPHIALSSMPLPMKIVSSLNLPGHPESYTSLAADPSRSDTTVHSDSGDDEILVCFASTFIDGQMDTWAFRLPTLRGYFSGVGDLFSALVLAHLDDDPRHWADFPLFPYAVSRALLTVQQILLKTHLYSLSQTGRLNHAAPRYKQHADATSSGDHTLASVVPSDGHPDPERFLDSNDPRAKATRMRKRELRIIQERRLIIDDGQGWPGRRIDWSSSSSP